MADPQYPDEVEIDVVGESVDLAVALDRRHSFGPQPDPVVREGRLLEDVPWIRSIPVEMKVQTEGWKFPVPPFEATRPKPKVGPPNLRLTADEVEGPPEPALPDAPAHGERRPPRIKPRPTGQTVVFKDRLLYLLQPPLDNLFSGKQVSVPFQPFPYQLEGIAFLMPRHSALLADEMGLGKTAQAILTMRLLFQAGLLQRALVVCPKPLVHNWTNELKLWAADLPYEVFHGDTAERRATWTISRSPLKLINYEALTRDVDILKEPGVGFDLVILDEAQRIKNAESRTSLAVRSLKRSRSWALTGTPIENSPDDLVNIFAFVDEGRIPPDTPSRRLAAITSDAILRRTKDQVQADMPPKIIRDVEIELTPAQRETYMLAENDGIVHLNELGDTITVHHVFQLVMRLKQICNFDPRTGQSSKLELLMSDMQEVAASGRKALVFSQWVEPLEVLARALKDYGPLQFHGRIPSAQRPGVLEDFKNDPDKHVLLMSYGTGSVGLNLQFANYVFLFDRWWNPAIEDQAINRAHRIGQQSTVTVTRMVSEGTIEKRISEILEKKRAVFNELLNSSEAPPILGLTEAEIFQLFDIKARPKGKLVA